MQLWSKMRQFCIHNIVPFSGSHLNIQNSIQKQRYNWNVIHRPFPAMSTGCNWLQKPPSTTSKYDIRCDSVIFVGTPEKTHSLNKDKLIAVSNPYDPTIPPTLFFWTKRPVNIGCQREEPLQRWFFNLDAGPLWCWDRPGSDNQKAQHRQHPGKMPNWKMQKKHHSLCWFNSSFEMNQSLWECICRHSACFIVRKTVWNFNLPGANCGFVCQYDTCWIYVAWESFEIVPVNAKGWMTLSTSSPTKNTNPLNLSWQAQKLSKLTWHVQTRFGFRFPMNVCRFIWGWLAMTQHASLHRSSLFGVMLRLYGPIMP